MENLSDIEVEIKLQRQKERFYKAEKMFEENGIGFQTMHYDNLCNVLNNITALTKERNRRLEGK